MKTFVNGPIDGVVVEAMEPIADNRGWLVELWREDELPRENWPAMAYLSMTLPGETRGPHAHLDQSDAFAFVGPGDFEIRLWDDRYRSLTRGKMMCLAAGESRPSCIIVPPGVVHGYKVAGDRPGYVFNAPNRLYAGEHRNALVDEIRYENRADVPYKME